MLGIEPVAAESESKILIFVLHCSSALPYEKYICSGTAMLWITADTVNVRLGTYHKGKLHRKLWT